MSWTDKASLEHIKKLRDIFKVKLFVETGTFNGNNARVQSKNFETIITCELNRKSFNHSLEKLKDYENVIVINENSPKFLKRFTNLNGPVIFYLDAHFYNINLPKGKRFIVLDELDSLRKIKDCIIIIHDFDNNLGHIIYDNQPLNFNLLKDKLLKINKNFKFYTNELSSCDPKKVEEAEDMDELDNLIYAWSKPEKTYRGFLYCLPEEVKIDGLKRIG